MLFLFIRIIGVCNICKNIAKALKFNLVDFGGKKLNIKKLLFVQWSLVGWLVEWKVIMFNLRRGEFDGVNLFQIL